MDNKFSHAVAQALIPKSLDLPEEAKAVESLEPGVYIERILDRLMATQKLNNGKRKSIGSTSRHADIKAYKKHLVNRAFSKNIQFPSRVKLEDGRDRYFYKYGMLVDRLAEQ